ncbi:hypothetical protein N0V94_004761 [Neodidymelliopsis sp. IMI 364377]|nr:hypothetical protein N0V94_004761 [Neodidymelliopsis sp. IMI 364377]
MSRFLPTLVIDTCFDDDSRHLHLADSNRSDDEALYVAPLRLRPSKSTANPNDENSGDETVFTYSPGARESDDVFSQSDATPRSDWPLSEFTNKLLDTRKSSAEEEIRTPSVTSLASLATTSTPSPTRRLRHTALASTLGYDNSIRSQYTVSELKPVPKPQADIDQTTSCSNRVDGDGVNRDGTDDTPLRVAPSLEDELQADGFKVYEEGATAAAAPIVRDIVPDVVDVRRPETPTTSISSSDKPSPLRSKQVSTALSSSHASVAVPTMPFEVLKTIAFSAAYGDAECRTLATKLCRELTEGTTSTVHPRWGPREQHLLHQINLVLELDLLVQHGYLRSDIFTTIRTQLFPTALSEPLDDEDLMMYLQRAAGSFELDQARAMEILELAIGDGDSEECSIEEATGFAERGPFDPQGFAYSDNGMYQEIFYRRLSSVPSTCATFEPSKSKSKFKVKSLAGCMSSRLFARIVQVFKFRHWKWEA